MQRQEPRTRWTRAILVLALVGLTSPFAVSGMVCGHCVLEASSCAASNEAHRLAEDNGCAQIHQLCITPGTSTSGTAEFCEAELQLCQANADSSFEWRSGFCDADLDICIEECFEELGLEEC